MVNLIQKQLIKMENKTDLQKDIISVVKFKANKIFKNGKQEGVHKIYYSDGTIDEESNYKNGRKDGVEISYFEDGRVHYEVNYKDGLRNGIRRTYSLSNNSYIEQEFRDDLLIDSKLEQLTRTPKDALDLLNKNNLLFQGNRGRERSSHRMLQI